MKLVKLASMCSVKDLEDISGALGVNENSDTGLVLS